MDLSPLLGCVARKGNTIPEGNLEGVGGGLTLVKRSRCCVGGKKKGRVEVMWKELVVGIVW